MNNLLAKSLSEYIISECEKAIIDNNKNEVRLFMASFSPTIVKEVLETVEIALQKNFDSITIPIIKISNPLWLEWSISIERELKEFFIKKNWVDTEDRLTSYRNQKCPIGLNGLVVLLIGVDKVLDQGGLADFQTITENIIWKRTMKSGFQIWVKQICDALLGDHSEDDIEAICSFIDALHMFIPRDLNILAMYLQQKIVKDEPVSDFLEKLYRDLPAWGIPAIINFKGTEKKRLSTLKKAITFINYSEFLLPAKQKRALKKINDYKSSNKVDFDINKNDFITNETELFVQLENYIKDNNSRSKNKIKYVDFQIIDEILMFKGPTPPRNKNNRPFKLEGLSIDAFIKSIWICLKELKSSKKLDFEDSQSIRIELDSLKFSHDLGSNDDSNIEAQGLIKCCISGIDTYLNSGLEFNSEKSNIAIQLNLKFPSGAINLGNSRTAAPFLSYNLLVFDNNSENSNSIVRTSFKWVLSDIQEERVLYNLAKNALNQIKLIKPFFPAYEISTFNEMFFASDSNEASRLLMLGENDLNIVNLLEIETLKDCDSKLKSLISELRETYTSFLDNYIDLGFYQVISQPINDLVTQYVNVGRELAKNWQETNVFNLFYKSFLVIPKSHNKFENHLDSAIVTGFHPATLEILQARADFLCKSFSELVIDFFLNEDRLM